MKVITLSEQARKKYLGYIRLFPKYKPKNLALYTTAILTLLTLSFFIIFAIKPTLTTIIDLKKQIADSAIYRNELKTKIAALSVLQSKYEQMPNDIQMIQEDIPQTPNVATFLAQIQTIANDTQTQLTSLQSSPVGITKRDLMQKQAVSFTFSVNVQGTYDAISNFLTRLSNFQRIISITSLNITKDDKSNLTLSIQGKTYFKP